MSVVTSGSTRRMTEPPGPPLPPSGPPSGLNFSRCTDATPLPPRPARTCSRTRSTNVGTAMGTSLSGCREMPEGRPGTGTPFLGGSQPWSVTPRPGRCRCSPDGEPTRARWAGHGGPSVRSGFGNDVDDPATAPGAELDRTGCEREQRVVATAADVVARVEVRAALADDDLAGVDDLAAEALHAEALGVGVAPVLGGRGALLVCHLVSPSGSVDVEISRRQALIAVTLTWVYF